MRTARKRAQRGLAELIGNTAYIIGLWLLSLAAMLACLALLALALPAMASADETDTELVQLEQTAQQWWAGWGLTTDTPYAANGGPLMPGCGANVPILREHLPSDTLGEVFWPHGCDIHIDEDLVRAGLTASPRTDKIVQALTQAGLNPRGRNAAAALLCAVMLHEDGHALGLPHQPTGIMQDKPPSPPQVCVAWAATTPPWRVVIRRSAHR